MTYFVGYLVQNNKKASTIRSYISAIRSVLQDIKVTLKEDKVLLASLTKACRFRNHHGYVRLPIQKGVLSMILKQVESLYHNQPYLIDLYKALFSTAYFGLFRVGELTKGEHPVLAKNVFIGTNKKKLLFVLQTSKTHWKDNKPQEIKISSTKSKGIQNKEEIRLPCPFRLLMNYKRRRGPYYNDDDPFFVFRDGSVVKPEHFRSCLKMCLKAVGFDEHSYNTHSLRLGRSCDLYKLGVSVETIKKLGRWKSNTVFTYLRNC